MVYSPCRYSYMIDNIILLITGTLHQRQIGELRSKCHPLGSFEEMESVNIANTPAELYSAVLVDTPLGGWSGSCGGEAISSVTFSRSLFQDVYISDRPGRTEHRDHQKFSLQGDPQHTHSLSAV